MFGVSCIIFWRQPKKNQNGWGRWVIQSYPPFFVNLNVFEAGNSLAPNEWLHVKLWILMTLFSR